MSVSDRHITALTLERLRVSDRFFVPESLLTSLSVASWEEFLQEELAHRTFQLSAEVLADRLLDETVPVSCFYETYASWWQHTKAVHFPTFSRWLNRHPRMQTHIVTRDVRITDLVTFPEMPVYPSQMGPGVRKQDVFLYDQSQETR